MKAKLVDTTSIEEIHSILNNATPEKAVIWQNSPSGRNIFKLSSIEYSDALDTVKVHIEGYDGTILIGENLYIKLSYRDAMFKAQVVRIEGGVISLELPHKVMAIDSRKSPRSIFDIKDNKRVSLKVVVDISSSLKSELEFKLLNISSQGLCLIVSDNNKVILDNSSKLFLVALGGNKLFEEIEIDLCYLHRFRYRDKGKLNQVYRAGFELSKVIESSDLEIFTDSSK